MILAIVEQHRTSTMARDADATDVVSTSVSSLLRCVVGINTASMSTTDNLHSRNEVREDQQFIMDCEVSFPTCHCIPKTSATYTRAAQLALDRRDLGMMCIMQLSLGSWQVLVDGNRNIPEQRPVLHIDLRCSKYPQPKVSVPSLGNIRKSMV